jgi:hypothetical protein
MSWWGLLLLNLGIRSAERQERKAGWIYGDALIDRIRARWGR